LSRKTRGPASCSDYLSSYQKQVFFFKALFQTGFYVFDESFLPDVNLILRLIEVHAEDVPEVNCMLRYTLTLAARDTDNLPALYPGARLHDLFATGGAAHAGI